MAQGGGRAVGRRGPGPGRGRPRQDHRRGHGPAHRGSGRARHALLACPDGCSAEFRGSATATGPDGTLPGRRAARHRLPGRPGPRRRLRAPRVPWRGSHVRGRPGRRRLYAHAYRAVDLKPGGSRPRGRSHPATRRGTPRAGRRPGRSTRPGCLGLQPAHAANPGGRRMEAVDHSRRITAAANCATAASCCTGWMPTPRWRFPPTSSNPNASSARSPGSRDGRWPMGRSPSGSNPAARRGPGWSHPTASRSIAIPPAQWPRWWSPRGRCVERAEGNDGPLFADEAGVIAARSDQLRQRLPVGRGGPAHLPRLDPGRNLPHPGLHARLRRRRARHPQGVHGPARRDTRPGRHRHRQAAGTELTVSRAL